MKEKYLRKIVTNQGGLDYGSVPGFDKSEKDSMKPTAEVMQNMREAFVAEYVTKG